MKDVFGMVFSGLCIVHCLMAPLLLPLLAVAGVIAIADEHHPHDFEWVHWALLAPVALFALRSLPQGWKRHGYMPPMVIGLLGLALMVVSLFAPHEFETYIAVVAGLMLVYGHWMNRKRVLNIG